MSDRNIGFQFIPGPSGHGLTDKEFLSSSIARQEERDHRESLMLGAVIVLIICLSAFFVLHRWRSK